MKVGTACKGLQLMFNKHVPAIQENMLVNLVQRCMTGTSHQMNPLDVWQREETAENQQPNKQVYTNQNSFIKEVDISSETNSVPANLISNFMVTKKPILNNEVHGI